MQWWVPGLGVLSSGAPLGHVMVAQEFTTTPGVWVGGSRSPEPLLVSGQVVVICNSPQSLCRHCPALCEHSHREKKVYNHPSPHTHHKQWQLASKVAQASSAYTPSHCCTGFLPLPHSLSQSSPRVLFLKPEFQHSASTSTGRSVCQAEECRTSALTICAVFPVLWLQRNDDCIFL